MLLVQMYGYVFSINYFCGLFGKSRQAFYEQRNQSTQGDMQDALALRLVKEIREDLPRCGTSKLHTMLQSQFKQHGIKMGRDALYDLLGRYGLLIRFRRRKPFTTNSNHVYKKYPNLIREIELTQAGELWVSDITYIRKATGFSYLSIITDAYSHKIVGYKLHPTLAAEGAIDALIMAAEDEKKTGKLIHHSDRGIQYCCADYVRMIEHFGIRLSMTEKGDPYENAIAERVNGILKNEFLLGEVFLRHQVAAEAVDNAVKKYNEVRLHDSCNRQTPASAHEQTGAQKKLWKQKIYKQQHEVQEEKFV